MTIHGISRLTLLDFPGHTACTLFVGGCSFRCPFCQNGSLVLSPETEPEVSREEIFSFLKKRRHLLQGVCITGGEPTLQNDLPQFIEEIRSLGYLVKLDTNGYNPDMLEYILKKGLIQYAAMDIKSSREHYARAAGLQNPDIGRIERSADLLMKSGIPFEFRTTMAQGLQTREDMESIGRWLAGPERYFLQHYEDSPLVLDRNTKEMPLQEMEQMLSIVKNYIPAAALRGI